jgi:hypothetical protein
MEENGAKWQKNEGRRIENGGWKKVGSKGWCGELKGIRDGGGKRGIGWRREKATGGLRERD